MEYWKLLRNALGSCQLIMPAAVGAILKDNHILLVKSSSSNEKWSLPGGLQELNESIEETAIREIKEELGIELEVDKLISVYSSPRWIIRFPNKDIIQQVLFFFLMKGEIGGRDFTIQNEEIMEYGFFDLDNLPEDITTCCKEKINDLMNFKGTVFLK